VEFSPPHRPARVPLPKDREPAGMANHTTPAVAAQLARAPPSPGVTAAPGEDGVQGLADTRPRRVLLTVSASPAVLTQQRAGMELKDRTPGGCCRSRLSPSDNLRDLRTAHGRKGANGLTAFRAVRRTSYTAERGGNVQGCNCQAACTLLATHLHPQWCQRAAQVQTAAAHPSHHAAYPDTMRSPTTKPPFPCRPPPFRAKEYFPCRQPNLTPLRLRRPPRRHPGRSLLPSSPAASCATPSAPR